MAIFGVVEPPFGSEWRIWAYFDVELIGSVEQAIRRQAPVAITQALPDHRPFTDLNGPLSDGYRRASASRSLICAVMSRHSYTHPWPPDSGLGNIRGVLSVSWKARQVSW